MNLKEIIKKELNESPRRDHYIIAGHITSAKNLRSILKYGLNPKAKKVYGKDTSVSTFSLSMETMGGNYFTKDFEKLLDLAPDRRNGEDNIIILARISLNSVFIDEDLVHDFLINVAKKVVDNFPKVNKERYSRGGSSRQVLDDLLRDYKDFVLFFKENIFKELSKLELFSDKYLYYVKDNLDDKFLYYFLLFYIGAYRGVNLSHEILKLFHDRTIPNYIYDGTKRLTVVFKEVAKHNLQNDGSIRSKNFYINEPVTFSGKNKILSIYLYNRKTLRFTLLYGKKNENFEEIYQGMVDES